MRDIAAIRAIKHVQIEVPILIMIGRKGGLCSMGPGAL